MFAWSSLRRVAHHWALRVLKVHAALRHPMWRAALLRHGVLASSEHKRTLHTLRPTAVVDIGANRGQFSLVCRSLFPDVPLYAFEPLEEPCNTFASILGSDANVVLYRVAVDEASGSRVMHVSARDDSSSLLEIGAQADVFPGTGEVSRRLVNAGRLAEFLARSPLGGNAILKIDVQGNELATLRGCEELLEQFGYVYVEVSFQELYRGQALAGDVITWLLERGFRLSAVDNQIRGVDGLVIQADVLFVRA